MRNAWNSTFWEEDWDEDNKTIHDKRLDQADRDLSCDPCTGYGLGGMKDYIPFEKTEEQKAYDRKRKYSRGYYRKNTYIILPREKTAK